MDKRKMIADNILIRLKMEQPCLLENNTKRSGAQIQVQLKYEVGRPVLK